MIIILWMLQQQDDDDNGGGCSRGVQAVGTLATLAFMGVIGYSLATTNPATVDAACSALWSYMAVRSAGALLLGGGMACARGHAALKSPFCWAGMFVYYMGFALAGGLVLSRASAGPDAQLCSALLGHGPLVPLGWVYMSLDILTALLLAVVGVAWMRGMLQ